MVKINPMRIWIDADACPGVIKEIIFRASARTGIPVILVANQPVKVPTGGLVSSIQVPRGFDMADDKIIENIAAHDVVVTADIPLADAAIDKGALAINPRGELYNKDTIKDRLATRNLMQELRDSGLISGGPKALALKDRQAFANKLDAILTAYLRNYPTV
jgi:uncharacterized protein YaiI (UPF0178 family)